MSACRVVDGGIEVDVWVQPNARQDSVVGMHGDAVKVRVSAAPEKGRANDAVCSLIANVVGVRAQDVELVRGETSRNKTLRIVGVAPRAVVRRLTTQCTR